MRILLDESLPRTLARYLSEATVDRAAGSFDVFMTADQNLPYQQNLRGHDIRVVVLAAVTNRVEDLRPLLDAALEMGESLEPGEVKVVSGA